jgi:hypothetical protein
MKVTSLIYDLNNNRYNNDTVSVKGQNIDDDTCNRICNLLESNNKIKTLNMSINSLTDTHCKSISRLLRKNNSITKLDLSFNPMIGDEGFRLIVDSLIVNTSIKELNVQLCLLDDPCLLSKLLLHNKTLRKLNISFNYKYDTTGFDIGYIIDNKTITDIQMIIYQQKHNDLYLLCNRNRRLKPLLILMYTIMYCKDKLLCRLVLNKIIDWRYKIDI